MQKKNTVLLATEIKELEDDLINTLYLITKDSIDVNHSCLKLLESGLININELRNFSVLRDYDLMNRNPLGIRVNNVLCVFCFRVVV